MSIQEIPPRYVPKIWGSTTLEPWFPNQTQQTGEVWFPAGKLLIKFLFTTEDLSVQVHPDDEYAARHEQSLGKTEMWHILRASEGAKIAAGFQRPLKQGELQVALLGDAQAVMEHLAWHVAHAGDTFFIPAGSVHAIGAGIALCEIQQNSDVTYRLYDYGRPRELHLERALAVADCGCHEGPLQSQSLGAGHELLVDSKYFRVEKWQTDVAEMIVGDGFAVILEGNGTIGGQAFRAGTVWNLGADEVSLEPAGAVVFLTARAN